MATLAKTETTIPDFLKDSTMHANQHEYGELKTDFPLSEKDEIKQAEENMRIAAKKWIETF
jgi:hypothetical protein